MTPEGKTKKKRNAAPPADGCNLALPDPRVMLQREEGYAIHSVLYLAEHPGASRGKIAKDLDIPTAYLAKVLKRLSDAGIVESRQGRGGGAYLLADPAELTLLDVVEAISGPVIFDPCQLRPQCATQKRKGFCNLKHAWLELTARSRAMLGEVVFADLLGPARHSPPASTSRKVAAKASGSPV